MPFKSWCQGLRQSLVELRTYSKCKALATNNVRQTKTNYQTKDSQTKHPSSQMDSVKSYAV